MHTHTHTHARTHTHVRAHSHTLSLTHTHKWMGKTVTETGSQVLLRAATAQQPKDSPKAGSTPSKAGPQGASSTINSTRCTVFTIDWPNRPTKRARTHQRLDGRTWRSCPWSETTGAGRAGPSLHPAPGSSPAPLQSWCCVGCLEARRAGLLTQGGGVLTIASGQSLTHGQTDRQTERERETDRYRQAGRQTDRQTDSTDRQKGKQAGR